MEMRRRDRREDDVAESTSACGSGAGVECVRAASCVPPGSTWVAILRGPEHGSRADTTQRLAEL